MFLKIHVLLDVTSRHGVYSSRRFEASQRLGVQYQAVQQLYQTFFFQDEEVKMLRKFGTFIPNDME
jgi:hypothetical protein